MQNYIKAAGVEPLSKCFVEFVRSGQPHQWGQFVERRRFFHSQGTEKPGIQLGLMQRRPFPAHMYQTVAVQPMMETMRSAHTKRDFNVICNPGQFPVWEYMNY